MGGLVIVVHCNSEVCKLVGHSLPLCSLEDRELPACLSDFRSFYVFLSEGVWSEYGGG